MLKSTALVAAAAATLFAGHAAAADRDEVTVTERVPYGDLNLESEAGARAMLRRLSAASNRVCGGHPGVTTDLLRMRSWRACRRDSLTSAVAQLDAPYVSRLYAAAHAGRIEIADR